MATSGKVTKCVSKPTRGFTVQTSPGPPPVLVDFTGVDSDDYATALAAYTKGSDVDVSGTPPSCTGVTAK